MLRITLSVVVVAALAAVLFLVPAWAKSSGLVGEVGPGYTVEVKKDGKDLKTIKAGTYKIKVEDKAARHNFHLLGPSLNKKTGVSFKGDVTWTIRLKPGRYTYQCDVHYLSGMRGHFRVTA